MVYLEGPNFLFILSFPFEVDIVFCDISMNLSQDPMELAPKNDFDLVGRMEVDCAILANDNS